MTGRSRGDNRVHNVATATSLRNCHPERSEGSGVRCKLVSSWVLVCLVASGLAIAQNTTSSAPEKQQALWQKLETSINDVDRNLDGVLGIAILDLTDGHKYFLHENGVFAQASSIKICVLAELYRQAQQGRLNLTDLYTVNAADLVQDSDIMGGLTPGVTKITLRDLATMMVAVSDNSATKTSTLFWIRSDSCTRVFAAR